MSKARPCPDCRTVHHPMSHCAKVPLPPAPSEVTREAHRRAMTKDCFSDCSNGALHCGCGERALYILAAEVRRLSAPKVPCIHGVEPRTVLVSDCKECGKVSGGMAVMEVLPAPKSEGPWAIGGCCPDDGRKQYRHAKGLCANFVAPKSEEAVPKGAENICAVCYHEKDAPGLEEMRKANVIRDAIAWAKDYEAGTEASHTEETRLMLYRSVMALAALSPAPRSNGGPNGD